MNRRKFLKRATPVLMLLAGGKVAYSFINHETGDFKRTRLRFAVVSDAHYGQPGTDYDRYFKDMIFQINSQHKDLPLDCCIVNGDLIHNDPSFLKPVKALLDQLNMPYYVTQGNHDMVNPEKWLETWEMPVNHHIELKKQAFLMATTSNEKGEYLCPNLTWMKETLEHYKQAENIFIFIHITPVKWTKYGIDCPDFIDLLKGYPNIRLVCNGHDHDQDDVKMKNSIPYLFDGHMGSNWGTDYRGFRIIELLKDNTITTWMLNPAVKIKEHSFESRV
jgi:hypothetical protein